MSKESFGRWLLTHEGLVKGYVLVESGETVEVCTGTAPEGSSKALVMPAFVNAHTHIGDSFAYPAPKGSVEEIVGPPNGYKHRMLRTVSSQEKMDAMRDSISFMARTGTCAFMDFREEGVDGIRMAAQSAEGIPIDAKLLGRPTNPNATEEALSELVSRCDGFGMSSLRDWPRDLLVKASRAARNEGKLFGIHASEVAREDIDAVLGLKPDFLVHMTAATDGDVAVVADAGVPVVVCPRSNRFFGLDPGIPRLLEAGVEVALGTDNGMICRPDMVEELRAAYEMSASAGSLAPVDAIRLATFSGRKVLNAVRDITTEIRHTDDLVVVGVQGDDPVEEMVSAAGSARVEAVSRGGSFRRI